MQFIAFGDLNIRTEHIPNGLSKGLSAIAPISQNAGDSAQARLISLYGLQSALTVGHLGGGDRNRVRQAQRVDQNVAFDA